MSFTSGVISSISIVSETNISIDSLSSVSGRQLTSGEESLSAFSVLFTFALSVIVL